MLKCLSARGNSVLKLLRDEANFERRTADGKRRRFEVWVRTAGFSLPAALIKRIIRISHLFLKEGAVNMHRPSVVHTHRGLRVPPLAFTESSGSPNV